MIVLFTDFGHVDPYVGQLKNVLAQQLVHHPSQQATSITVIDLLHHAPKFNPLASAYLLAAYVREFSSGTVFLAVVDPGVGSLSRRGLVLKIDGRWYVGPDNGLFNTVILQAENSNNISCWEIIWRPEKVSNTFHGRDIFAPVAAKIALTLEYSGKSISVDSIVDSQWALNLYSIIYIDHFGNAMSGIQANNLAQNAVISINNKSIRYARTYSEVELGVPFWYPNANGLIEVAVNQGSASQYFELTIGAEIIVPESNN